MRDAPRAYGVRMSCKFAALMFVFAALGLYSAGWFTKVAWDHWVYERINANQLEQIRELNKQIQLYQAPPATINQPQTINLRGWNGEETSYQDCPPGKS